MTHCAQPVPCPTGGCPCGDELRAETTTTDTTPAITRETR